MRPVFFFSYAHDNRAQHSKVDDFFDALASMVAQKMAISSDDAGYMDRLPPGTEWNPALVGALQNSAVLVALVSPHYISSHFCGKELQVFLKRRVLHMKNNPGTSPGVILPIMWMTTPGRPWPDVLQPFQHAGGLLPAKFAERGLHSLMMSSDTEGYNTFVEALADAIVAASTMQPALEKLPNVVNFDDVDNAFAPVGPQPSRRASPNAVSVAPPDVARLFYVAAPQDEMNEAQAEEDPPRRLRTSTAHYGRRGYYWQPYHPTVALRVGDIAAGAISGFEYKPGDPDLIRKLLQEVKEADEAGEISVVIVDPWTLRIATYRELMTKLDQQFTAKSCVIIPWNEEDEETRQCEGKLHAAVRLTFQRLDGNTNRFRYPVKSSDALALTIKELLTGISMTATELLAARLELGGPPLATLSNAARGPR